MYRAKRLRSNIWVWGMTTQLPKLQRWLGRARRAIEMRKNAEEVQVFKKKGFSSYTHCMF